MIVEFVGQLIEERVTWTSPREIGPRIVITTTRIASVGNVLPSNASATSLISVSCLSR